MKRVLFAALVFLAGITAAFAQPATVQQRAVVITGAGTGSTGAVTATLAAAPGLTTYICGFHVDSTGTGALGPITLAGITGGSQIYQATAGGANGDSQTFSPCIPATGPNTAITMTTTADGSATAVDVNLWGYQQ